MTTSTSIAAHRSRALDWALIVAFLAALLSPAIDQVVRSDLVRGPLPENRKAAPRPPMPKSWADVKAFPNAYDAYYRDTFGLRDVLLAANSVVSHYVFQVGTSSTLVPGGRDWINYAGEWTMEVFRGMRPFTRAELVAWQTMLETRNTELAKLGIRYLFVIGPNKETIYPERVPARYNRIGPTRLDQFVEWMALNSKVEILDLRPALMAEKVHDEPGNYLYNPLGTHWGVRGAIVAYRTLVGKVQEWFPNTRMLTSDELLVRDTPTNSDSWSAGMYIPRVLVEQERHVEVPPALRHSPLILENGPPFHAVFEDDRLPGPRVYFYHDSFGLVFFVPGPATFSKFESMQTAKFELGKVQASKAELVIELFVERTLATRFVMPPSNSLATQHALGAKYPVVLSSSGSTRLTALFPDGRRVVHGSATPERVTTAWLETNRAPQLELELGVDSVRAGVIDVYWRTDESEPFVRANKSSVPVPAGTARVRTQFEVKPTARCQFQLLARDQDQSSKIRWFELRAAPH